MLPGLMKDLAKFFAMLLLLLPVNSFSLGLGEIKLHSALNQALDAEIGLLSVGRTDVADIVVKLASREAFEKAGIDRPHFLTQFKFQVAKRVNGDAYLKITSRETVKEPFLDFIIEANWPGGRVLREYTLLLDPPVLVDERPAALDIPLLDDELPSDEGAAATSADSAAGQTSRELPRFTPRTTTLSTTESGEAVYGPVKRTDTLWRIASQMRPDKSVTVQQVMIALLNENPEAFETQNINDLKAGYFLRISDPATISDISPVEAERIAKLHYEQWVDAKHSTALAAGQRPLGVKGKTAGASSGSAAEPRLTLVAPDEGDSQMGSGSVLGASDGDVRQELAFALESVDVSRQENEELRKRLSALEEQLASMQRLITLKGDTLSAMQVGPEGLAVEETVDSVSETLLPEEAALSTAPLDGAAISGDETQGESGSADSPVATPPPAVVPATPAVEASIVDEALAIVSGVLASAGAMLTPVLGGVDPMLAVGGLALVGLLVGALVMRRRKAAFEDEMAGSDSSDYSAQAEEGAAAADEVVSDEAVESVLNDVIPDYSGSGGMDVCDEDEIDAIAEADVYLAYRRFDKAEELLSEAVQNEPERHDIQVKLLEVYAASEKKEAFIEQAERLKASLGSAAVDSALWKNVAEMGRAIAPTSLLFNDEVDAVMDSTGMSDELDVELPDLGGELDLGELDLSDADSAADSAAPVSESDNPFADVSEDGIGELDGLGDGTLDGAFDTLDDLDELEASLDSAMDMVSDKEESHTALDVDSEKKASQSDKTTTDSENSLDNVELDTAVDADAGDTLDLSDELSFEEVADETVDVSDDLSLELSDSDELSLDDADATTALDNNELDSANDLEFEAGLAPEENGAEDLGDELLLVDEDATTATTETATESITDSDNDIEEDLFAGLEESEGSESSDDDWLADLSDDISSLDDNLDDIDDSELFSAEDEVGTKLDLARAYIDMGDSESAKGILDEVVSDGNDEQKKDANELIERIA